jgi:lipid-binding SYLF domain-containing protein
MKISKMLPVLAMLLALSSFSVADTAREIDADANEAIAKFYSEVNGAQKFVEGAKGYVIFPDVKEAGFFVGGKYGEGVLRVNNVSKSYHSIASASFGAQMGIQKYSLIIVFTSDDALKRFSTDDDWESDLDINFALAEWNAEEENDEIDFGANMVGYVFDSTGMMGNFTFEGTKFDIINPDFD